jgi:hypothetical protein
MMSLDRLPVYRIAITTRLSGAQLSLYEYLEVEFNILQSLSRTEFLSGKCVSNKLHGAESAFRNEYSLR